MCVAESRRSIALITMSACLEISDRCYSDALSLFWKCAKMDDNQRAHERVGAYRFKRQNAHGKLRLRNALIVFYGAVRDVD